MRRSRPTLWAMTVSAAAGRAGLGKQSQGGGGASGGESKPGRCKEGAPSQPSAFPPTGGDTHVGLRQGASGLPLAPWRESSLDGSVGPVKVSLHPVSTPTQAALSAGMKFPAMRIAE